MKSFLRLDGIVSSNYLTRFVSWFNIVNIDHEGINFQGIKCGSPKLGDKVTLRYTALSDHKQFWRSEPVVTSRVALFRGDTCVGRISYQDHGLVQAHHLSPMVWKIDVLCHGGRRSEDWDILEEDHGYLVKDN